MDTVKVSPKVEKLIKQGNRAFLTSRELFDLYMEETKKAGYPNELHEVHKIYDRYLKWKTLAEVIAYIAYLTHANDYAEMGEWADYIKAMNSTNVAYGRLMRRLHNSNDYNPVDYGYIYLGGKVNERTAKLRANKQAKEKGK